MFSSELQNFAKTIFPTVQFLLQDKMYPAIHLIQEKTNIKLSDDLLLMQDSDAYMFIENSLDISLHGYYV